MQRTFIQRCNRREVWILLASLGLLWAMLHPPQALVAQHHAWKARQAFQSSDEGRMAGNWELALATAEQGLRWAPDSIRLQYLVIVAAAAQEKAIDQALLAKIFLDPSTSSQQRAKLLSVALDGGDQVIFSRLYNTLDDDGRTFPGIAVQRMRLSLQLGRHPEVAELFEQLSEEARSPAVRHLRIGALVQSGDFLKAQKAISQFLANAEDENDEIWPTIRLLDTIPLDQLHRPVLSDVVGWIVTASNAPAGDRLIADRIEISALKISERPAYLKMVIGRHREVDTPALGHWLTELGFGEMALALPGLSPESASKEITAYQARLAALVATERWQDAWHWLEDPPKGAHAVLQWLARAQLAHQLGRASDRRQSLARAIDSAAIITSENTFFVISEVANRLGENELATQAAMNGVQVPSAIAPPAPFFLPTLRHLWQEDRLDEFRQLNRLLLLREPGDLQRNNDELYLSLLLDENPKLPDIVAIGRRLIAAHPDNLSFSTTLAWALLRSGEAGEAATFLNNPQLDWSQAGPADLLVRDLIDWEVDGTNSKKSEYSTKIDATQLCSAEQELLLKTWRSQRAEAQ